MNSKVIVFLLTSLGLISAIAQEPNDDLREIDAQLDEARQDQKRLQAELEFSNRRIEILTEIRQLRQKLLQFEQQIETAENDGDERQIERLKKQAEAAEFQFEYLNRKRELFERRADLTNLTVKITADHRKLKEDGEHLLKMATKGEALVDDVFEVYRNGPEDREAELEEQIEELDERLDRRIEILHLRMELIEAIESGEDEWIEKTERELNEIGGLDNEHFDRGMEPRQSFNMKNMPPPMNFTAQEMATIGELNLKQHIVPLLKGACFECHDNQSASGDLNLEHLISKSPLVVNRKDWVNVIEQLKVRSMPPPDADQPTENDRRVLAAWLTNAIDNFDYETVRQPGYELARRLTHDEYNNTVRDLTGIDLRPADRFPADMSASSGFENSANSLFLQPVLLERYLGAAELIVDAAWPEHTGSPEQQAAWKLLLGGVRDLNATGAVKSVLHSFASRAYRRAVEANEVHGLVAYFDRQLREGRSPKSALKDVLQVILASPSFLIRAESVAADPDTPFRISDWELASRLSYFLWASMPDDELFRLAEAGKLHQPEILHAQVVRMLNDPRAETLGTVFAAQWLGFAALPRVPRSPIDNPWQTDSLIAAMQRESALLFHSIVVQNEPLDRLIDADYTFVNEELANHYEMDNVAGDQLRKVSLADTSRRGLLGHGSVLAVTSFPGRTSPVVRGNWILSELLGTPPPPPPPNVSQFDEKVAEDRRLTSRQKLELHRDNPNCYGCHSQIDPLGFALEEFEWFGRYQPKRRGKPVNASAQLPEGEPFRGLTGLCDALLSERVDDLTTQVARKMLSYGLGRQLEYYDEATVRDLVKLLESNNRRLQTLIHGIVQSDAFLMKQ